MTNNNVLKTKSANFFANLLVIPIYNKIAK